LVWHEAPEYHRDNVTDCLNSQKDRSQVDNIYRRYPFHEPIRGRTVERSRLFVTPSPLSGMVNKLEFLGLTIDSIITTIESREFDKQMQKRCTIRLYNDTKHCTLIGSLNTTAEAVLQVHKTKSLFKNAEITFPNHCKEEIQWWI
jgi:hypothetical protein